MVMDKETAMTKGTIIDKAKVMGKGTVLDQEMVINHPTLGSLNIIRTMPQDRQRMFYNFLYIITFYLFFLKVFLHLIQALISNNIKLHILCHAILIYL